MAGFEVQLCLCVLTVIIYVMFLSILSFFFYTFLFFCDTEMRKQAAKKENTGNK